MGQRIAAVKSDASVPTGRLGNLQMTYSTEKKAKYLKQHERDLKKHREERQKVIRPIKSLHLKKYVPKQWAGVHFDIYIHCKFYVEKMLIK